MPSILQCVIAGWLTDQAGVARETAHCGAVTLIPRIDGALKLTGHFLLPPQRRLTAVPPTGRAAPTSAAAG